MGLDMYLTRKTYIGIAEHRKYSSFLEGHKVIIDIPGVNPDKVTQVEEEALYWRKANAIHGWFVDNVQDNIDDCGEYYVTDENLETLLQLCKDVLSGKEDRSELPGRAGFFFGPAGESEEELEYYRSDLEYTVKGLEKALAGNNDFSDFYYHSSW